MSLEQKLCEVITKKVSRNENKLSAAQYDDLNKEVKKLVLESMEKSDSVGYVSLVQTKENYKINSYSFMDPSQYSYKELTFGLLFLMLLAPFLYFGVLSCYKLSTMMPPRRYTKNSI